MKKSWIFALCGLLILALFTACGGDSSSAAPAPASSAAAPVASTPAASTPAASTAPSAAAGYDVEALTDQLAEAANLGTTILVSEIDLRAGGVNTDSIVAFDGAESQLSAENGGIVMVIEATDEAAAQTLATELEGFRDMRAGNEDYAEFEVARTNTAAARIQAFGNYVVYAVSATGHEGGWDALDNAISTAFA